ncbi:hypothetical protein GCM10027445_67730 [Amycolatopsis endophytica]
MLREIVDKADVQAVEGFRSAVRQAGPLRTARVGGRTRSSQIARRVVEYKRRGANLLLLGFLHAAEPVGSFP